MAGLIDFLEQLKHNSPRLPINLKRIPQALQISIFLKSSSSTVKNLRETCSRCTFLVDIAITKMRTYPQLEAAVRAIGKEKLFNRSEADETVHIFRFFRIQEATNLLVKFGDVSLDDMAQQIIEDYVEKSNLHLLEKKLGDFLRERKDQCPLEASWKKCHLSGPKSFPHLEGLGDKLMDQIIRKMCSKFLFRLMGANKFFRDSVIKKMKSIGLSEEIFQAIKFETLSSRQQLLKQTNLTTFAFFVSSLALSSRNSLSMRRKRKERRDRVVKEKMERRILQAFPY